MTSWQLAQLGEVVCRPSTWNPATNTPLGVFVYVDLSAVNQETKQIVGARHIASKDAPSRARQLVAAGDVLVSTVRPNLNSVARVQPELDGATASTGFCVLRPRIGVLDPDYLFHWVRTSQFVASMTDRASGASYPAVSDRIVLDSSIPLPPLEEQRRIAEVLDRAEALRAKRREALCELDTLTQSIFLHSFGPGGDTRSTCTTARLGDLCSTITDGVHQTPRYVSAGIPFVTVKNMVTGRLDLSSTKFISAEDHRTFTRRTRPERGDVLVSKDGTIGASCPVLTDRDFSVFVSVALLKPKFDVIEQTFLAEQFRSPTIQRQIASSSKGIAIRHLHLNDFRRLEFVVPTLEAQRTFCSKIDAATKLRAMHEKSLTELDTLFASLQYRAFRGEL